MVSLLYVYNKLPPLLQNISLSAYGLVLRKLRYGKSFHKTLSKLGTGDCDPFVDQGRRLQKIIDIALNQTEHYSALCKDTTLKSSEIDLYNFVDFFPVLEKSKVKEKPFAFHNKLNKENTTLLNTSGSTGTPLKITATKNSVMQNYAFFNLFLRSIGVDEFQRSATFAGRLIVPETSKSPPYWRKNYSMNTLLCSSYHLSDETIPLYIKALEDWQPVFIDSYPSAIYEIASFINKHKIKHTINLKVIVTSSETLGGHQVESIELAFGCPVYDQYGCAEMSVMAYQQKDGRYFLPPQYSVVEVLDDNDNPVKPGDIGHLVCTGLLNQAMPFIRYRMGDIVKTSEKQIEGYPYFVFLDSIEGRNDDVIINENGSRVGRLDPVFKGVEGVSEAQIIQKSTSLLQVNLVVSSEYDDTTEDQIRSALQDRVGNRMNIRFNYVDQIPREENGKFRFVKSEL